MTSQKVQELARDKLGQMQADIQAREDELKRVGREVATREAELTKLHVVNHVDAQ
jgi:hypothetical protein